MTCSSSVTRAWTNSVPATLNKMGYRMLIVGGFRSGATALCQALALPLSATSWPPRPRGAGGVGRGLPVGRASFLPGMPRGVGLGGGADSTAVFVACVENWQVQVRAIHIHHGLQAAAEDFARHCTALCDQLNVPLAIRLFEHFQGRAQPSFGIGTNLTNDLGYEALQIVIKMTRCNGQPVAKISDEPSKSMDYDPSYVKYLREVFQVPEVPSAV